LPLLPVVAMADIAALTSRTCNSDTENVLPPHTIYRWKIMTCEQM
jgi:hypothetical protein